jgi:hypothetical protein
MEFLDRRSKNLEVGGEPRAAAASVEGMKQDGVGRREDLSGAAQLT